MNTATNTLGAPRAPLGPSVGRMSTMTSTTTSRISLITRHGAFAFVFAMTTALLSSGCEGGILPVDFPGVDDPNDDPTTMPDANAAPRLSSLRAQASGVWGDHLLMEVTGDDDNGDAVALRVTFLDFAGVAVACFDRDIDGVLDVAPVDLAFDATLPTQPTFAGSVTVSHHLALFPMVARVRVAVVDSHNAVSDVLESDVEAQPIRAEGEACDHTYARDRCAPGFGCKGDPAVCTEGEAPVLERAAFVVPVVDTDGPTVIVRAADADSDIVIMRVEFFDAEGAPVSVDQDGDGVLDGSTFDHRPDFPTTSDAFTVSMVMGTGMDLVVSSVSVRVVDISNRESETMFADLGAPTTKGPGQICEVGFDSCANGNVCAPALNGFHACQNMFSLRTGACGNADELVFTGGGEAFVDGKTGLGSTFDAPGDCAANDPIGRPDAVVWVKLDVDAADVVLSTIHPSTNFDTTLYVLDQCVTLEPHAMACNDDAPGSMASSLSLGAMPKGDYAVVVDSFHASGGNFRLSVEVIE